MIYEALYSPNLGLVAFRCRCGDCTRVVRTERGIGMHCWRKHKIKLQMEMAYGEAEASVKHEFVRSPVRIVSGCFGGGAATVKVGGANSEDTVLFVDREVYKDPRDKS